MSYGYPLKEGVWLMKSAMVIDLNLGLTPEKLKKQRLTPLPVPNGVERQLLGDFLDRHGVGKVLLVGHHQKQARLQLLLRQHSPQLILALGNPVPVVTVNHVEHNVSVLVVVSVQRPLEERERRGRGEKSE